MPHDDEYDPEPWASLRSERQYHDGVYESQKAQIARLTVALKAAEDLDARHCYEARERIDLERDNKALWQSRAEAAEARIAALERALTKLKRNCFKHHQGDDSCSCDEIDAALSAAQPKPTSAEKGRME